MELKLSENIRTLRKEHGMTQEQLANALGVTVGAVYKWEAGLSIPEVRLLMEMADLSKEELIAYLQARNYYLEELVEAQKKTQSVLADILTSSKAKR